MPTKAEIDQAFLTRHGPLTERFYAMKQAGQITPALQALFDKAHSYLTVLHERDRIVGGYDPDWYVDEERDEDGNILTPGTKLRSFQAIEDLEGRFKLSNAKKAQVKNRWGVVL